MGEGDLSLLNSLVSATGWMLVHFLWQGCLIAALYWMVCAFSRQESAHVRYWAGLSSYLLALGTLCITFVICYEPAAEFATQPLQPEAVNSFLVMSGGRPDMWSFLQAGIEPALPLVVALWLLGVLILSFKTGVGWYGTRRWAKTGVTPIAGELQQSVERMIECLRVSQTVTVLKSSLVKVPMVIGWFRPVILLPVSVIANLPLNQLEMVIAHELGHIKRYDYLVNLLQIMLETLLFYHPAFRWVARRVRAEREHCCDDLVVTDCGKPVVYASALASLEALRSPVNATAMAATGGDLLARVRRIVDTELPRNGSGYAQVSMMVTVALVVALSAQQGLQLTRALTDIADSVRLQASDVEITTRIRSRAAWAEGVGQFARSGGFYQPPKIVEKSIPEIPPAETEMPAVVEKQDSQLSRLDVEPDSAPDPELGPELNAEYSFDHEFAVAGLGMLQEPVISQHLLSSPHTGEAGMPGKVIKDSAAASKPTALKPIKTAQPRYPWMARNRGQEGFVKLSFSVDSSGAVTGIQVQDSVPRKVFDRAAIKALKKWKFEAASDDTIPRRMVQTFDFNLEEEVTSATNHRECAVTGRRTCTRGPKDTIVVYINPPARKRASS